MVCGSEPFHRILHPLRVLAGVENRQCGNCPGVGIHYRHLSTAIHLLGRGSGRPATPQPTGDEKPLAWPTVCPHGVTDDYSFCAGPSLDFLPLPALDPTVGNLGYDNFYHAFGRGGPQTIPS